MRVATAALAVATAPAAAMVPAVATALVAATVDREAATVPAIALEAAMAPEVATISAAGTRGRSRRQCRTIRLPMTSQARTFQSVSRARRPYSAAAGHRQARVAHRPRAAGDASIPLHTKS